MNKKGQIGVGSIVIVAIAIIVGLVLLQASSAPVATITDTVTNVNTSFTAPGGLGQTVTLLGQANRNLIVVNGTNGVVIPASNYTIRNYVVSNGQLISTLEPNGLTTLGWQNKTILVTATTEPYGYDTNGGGRAIASLIIVFFALAIAVIALLIILKSGIIEF